MTDSRCSPSFWLTPLALLLALPARAEDPPQPQPKRTWRVELKGKRVGEERVTCQRGAKSRVLESEGRFQVTKAPFRYQATLEVDAQGKLVRYALSSKSVEASAAPAAKGIVLKARYGEHKVARRFDPQRRYALVLDTLCFAHFDLLAARVGSSRAPLPLLCLTPQSATGIEGVFTPGEAFKRRVGAQERTLRKGVLVAGKRQATLIYDPARGEALWVETNEGYRAYDLRWQPWSERELTLPPPQRGLRGLPATLCAPRVQRASAPGVLLLPDLGPGGRERAPLPQLAQALASAGLVVLRVEPRGTLLKRELQGGDPARRQQARRGLAARTFASELADAQAALRWLAARAEVKGVVVWASGLGAQRALALGEQAPKELRGLALAGLPSGSPEQALSAGILRALVARKAPPKTVEATRKQLGLHFQKIRAGAFPPGRDAGLDTVGVLRGLLARPPGLQSARTLRLPLFLLAGAADPAVTQAEWKALCAARQSATQDAALRLPKLGPLLLQRGEKVPPRLVEDLSRWARQVCAAPQKPR